MGSGGGLKEDLSIDELQGWILLKVPELYGQVLLTFTLRLSRETRFPPGNKICIWNQRTGISQRFPDLLLLGKSAKLLGISLSTCIQ